MRILLTGATGFIGSAFRKAALRNGHAVAALTRPGGADTTTPDVSGSLVLNGSLANAPWAEIERFEPEICVHAAWISTPGVYLESAENHRFLEWSVAFLEKLAQRSVPRFFVLGTCVEYAANQPQPLREEASALEPASTYARCKQALHDVLKTDARFASSKVAWGRVFYPFGVGEHPQRLCSSILSKLSRGEKMLLRSPHSVKDYIYIDDLAEAMLRVVEGKFQGEINLGTGVGVSVHQIACIIEKLLGRQGLVEIADPPQPDPLGDRVADVTRLKALGWRQATTLVAGLEKLVSALALPSA